MTPATGAQGPVLRPGTNLREALSALLTAQAETARIVAADGTVLGDISRAQILAA